MTYIKREKLEDIQSSLNNFKVVGVLGPRQVGKSTIAKKLISPSELWLDLERPADLRKLEEPETFLSQHVDKLVCIDEVQFQPDLFPVLRYLCDQTNKKGQFLILGSASPELLKQSSETLAGRIKFVELTPFLIQEVGVENFFDIWVRGGYPESFLSENPHSVDWRKEYIKTFLERDLAILGYRRSATQMRRFWTMLAHLQGQTLNQSKLAGSLDTTAPTIKSFLEMMVDTFMVRLLEPYHKNVKKRLVKTPKVYIRDSGLLHSLLDIDNLDELQGHPIYGASFEGFAIEQILSSIGSRWKPSFYRSAKGEELDLILTFKDQVIAIEIKCSKAPLLTKQNKKAIEVVSPSHTYIVSLVEESYGLSESITVTNITTVTDALNEI